MVGFANERALLAALADSFALSGRTRAGAGAGIPGVGGPGSLDGSGVPSLGGGGSVPGTATTGAGTANALIASGGGLPLDPVSQQVAGVIGFNNREPGERGDFGSLGTGGGDPFGSRLDLDPGNVFGDAALGMLTGGGLGAALAIAEAVANADELPVRGPGTGTELMNALNRPGGLGFREREIDERNTRDRNQERFGNERQPVSSGGGGRLGGRV